MPKQTDRHKLLVLIWVYHATRLPTWYIYNYYINSLNGCPCVWVTTTAFFNYFNSICYYDYYYNFCTVCCVRFYSIQSLDDDGRSFPTNCNNPMLLLLLLLLLHRQSYMEAPQASSNDTEKKGTHHPVQWGNRHRTEYVSQSQSISRPAASGVITRPNDDYFALKCCIYIVKWYHFNFSQPYTRPNGVNPIQ